MSPVLRALREVRSSERQDAQWETADVTPFGAVTFRARASQRLYDEGEPADSVYLLLQGEMALSIEVEERKPVNTQLLRAPALLGDRDVLVGDTSAETAWCLTPCVLWAWERRLFLDGWRTEAELQRWVSLDLAERFACSLRLRALWERPLRERLLGLQPELPSDATLEYRSLVTNSSPRLVQRALSAISAPPTAESPGLPLFHSLRRE